MHTRRHQLFLDTKFVRNFGIIETVGAGKLEDSSQESVVVLRESEWGHVESVDWCVC